MRNNTKLKQLLLKYSVTFDMDEDEDFRLTLTDRQTKEIKYFHGSSYAIVLQKAYYYFKEELKKNLKAEME